MSASGTGKGHAKESILVINAGSSSIKYELIDRTSRDTLASGLLQRIGEPRSQLRHDNNGRITDRSTVTADHEQGITQIVSAFGELGPDLDDAGVVAVGHRVVMGGPEFQNPVVISDRVMETIEALTPLAPLHNPANLAAIRTATSLLSDVPHIAVFDTAFFQGLPVEASTYAIDRALAAANSIRRYGFHGISHEYVSAKVTEMLADHGWGPAGGDTDAPGLRQIVLHLGNGASASAVVDGRAVDTSMGFTPLEGLVMGTRSGDIDPSVAFYLNRELGMSIDEVDHLLNHESGLKGLTGNNDMRDVHQLIAAGDPAARLALSIYVRRLQKYIGAYAAVMGGLDALTFTAGVGENDAVVRAGTVEPLGFLGMEIDSSRNTGPDTGPRLISTDRSKVAVLVVPTHEELSIAEQVASML